MTVIIEELDDQNDLRTIARIDQGDIVDGEDAISGLLWDGADLSDGELLDRFDGPTLFARQVDSAEAARGNPLDDVPVLPSDLERIDRDALGTWYAWVQSGKPDGTPKDAEARQFNPELHPRGPDGKFVERPWDVPDDLDFDAIRATPTLTMLEELRDAGEPIDEVLATDGISIDGIPDDVDSVDDAKNVLGKDGLVFQDMEPGDQVNIVRPDGQLTQGHVQKTEQVDGGPNRAHVVSEGGSVHVTDVPDGTSIRRLGGPVMPPNEVVSGKAITGNDIEDGTPAAAYQVNDDGSLTHLKTGIGSPTGQKVNISGDYYDPSEPNINVYDASAKSINPDDISEGDEIAAFIPGSGKKKGEGTVVSTADGDDLVPTIDIEDDDGNVSYASPDNTTFTKAGALDAGSPGVAEEQKQNLEEAAEELNDELSDPEAMDTSAVDPTMINVGEVIPEAMTKVESIDQVEAGDIVQFTPGGGFDTRAGRILETETSPSGAEIVEIDDGTSNPTVIQSLDELNGLSKIDDDIAVELGTGDYDDLDGVDPGDVGPGDIPQAAADFSVDIGDLQSGDWVVAGEEGDQNPDVGKISATKGNVMTVDMGDGSTAYLSDSNVGELGKIDPGLPSEPADGSDSGIDFEQQATNIDPSTISGTEIPASALGPADMDELESGQFIQYIDDDGNHAGKVKSVLPGGVGPDLKVETGHHSDPQNLNIPDDVKQLQSVDDETAVDLGDPAGVDTSPTDAASQSMPSFDIEDLQDNPRTPELTRDDVKAPVSDSPPGEGEHGVISEEHAEAFVDFLDEQGLTLEGSWVKMQSSTYSTSGPNLDYPQADRKKIESAIMTFMKDSGMMPEDMPQDVPKETLKSAIDGWKGSSYSDKGRTVENHFHSALNLPGDFRNDGLDGRDPTDVETRHAALRSLAVQRFIQNNFDEIEQQERFGVEAADDEIPMYRGVGTNAVASLARDWGEDPEADAFTVRESKITNHTTDSHLADDFAEQGVSIKTNAKVQDIAYSPDVMKDGSISDEAEFWVTGGVSGTDPSNVKVGDAGSDGVITMADLNKQPEDMNAVELEQMADLARAMNKRDRSLTTSSQVESWKRVLDSMQASTVSSYEMDRVRGMLKRSISDLSSDVSSPSEVDLSNIGVTA